MLKFSAGFPKGERIDPWGDFSNLGGENKQGGEREAILKYVAMNLYKYSRAADEKVLRGRLPF